MPGSGIIKIDEELFMRNFLLILAALLLAAPARPANAEDAAEIEAKTCKKEADDLQTQLRALEAGKFKDKKAVQSLLKALEKAPLRAPIAAQELDRIQALPDKERSEALGNQRFAPPCVVFPVLGFLNQALETYKNEFRRRDQLRVAKLGARNVNAYLKAKNLTLFESLMAVSMAAELSKHGLLKGAAGPEEFQSLQAEAESLRKEVMGNMQSQKDTILPKETTIVWELKIAQETQAKLAKLWAKASVVKK
jgi:hypothetical protein